MPSSVYKSSAHGIDPFPSASELVTKRLNEVILCEIEIVSLLHHQNNINAMLLRVAVMKFETTKLILRVLSNYSQNLASQKITCHMIILYNVGGKINKFM